MRNWKRHTLSVLILAIFTLLAAGSDPESSNTPVGSPVAQPAGPTAAEKRAQQQCEDKITAFVMSQDFVKDQLKAPATAKFPRFTNEDVRVTYLGDCTHEVRAFVDAENAFGAKLRN